MPSVDTLFAVNGLGSALSARSAMLASCRDDSIGDKKSMKSATTSRSTTKCATTSMYLDKSRLVLSYPV